MAASRKIAIPALLGFSALLFIYVFWFTRGSMDLGSTFIYNGHVDAVNCFQGSALDTWIGFVQHQFCTVDKLGTLRSREIVKASIPQPFPNLMEIVKLYGSPQIWDARGKRRTGARRQFFIHNGGDVNGQGHDHYRRFLLSIGWVEKKNYRANADLYLYNRDTVFRHPFQSFREGIQLINHARNDLAVLQKEPLLLAIRAYESSSVTCQNNSMVPATYRMHDKAECNAFFNNEKNAPDVIWFSKVVDGTYGLGIDINSFHALRELFLRKYSNIPSSASIDASTVTEACTRYSARASRGGVSGAAHGRLLVQQNVADVMLLDGHKIDTRSYILIANHKPFTAFYYEGYARKSLVKYEESVHLNSTSTVSKASFLTNTHFQTMSLPEADLGSDHHLFFDEVVDAVVQEYGYPRRKVQHAFSEKMKELLQRVLLAVMPNLEKLSGSYVLLGVDVIMTKDLRLRLLEVNTNPDIYFDDQQWGHKLPPMQWNLVSDMMCTVLSLQSYGWDQLGGLGSVVSKLESGEQLNWDWKVDSASRIVSFLERSCPSSGMELLYTETVKPPYRMFPGECIKER